MLRLSFWLMFPVPLMRCLDMNMSAVSSIGHGPQKKTLVLVLGNLVIHHKINYEWKWMFMLFLCFVSK